jgi:NAD(P)-dependent dehydrogenase (short-subunit alcohol dehydrogenase family)
MMRGLDGKVVVVAGGGNGEGGPGNGAATAIRVAEEGAKVVVGDIDLEAARSTVELIEQTGGTASAFGFDLTDEASVRALGEFATQTYGGVDGLHMNAADMAMAVGGDGESDAVSLPIEVWDRTIDVNLTGFLRLLKTFVPRLLERGGGSIVNTSADAAFIGAPVRVAYSASKAGLHAMTRHTAARWGRQGIRCNTVAPGLITRNEDDQRTLRESYGAPPRSTRYGTSWDIASAVTFLLSDEGAWVNGQVWSVNGGQVLR